MGYFGNDNSTLETALFICLAVISGQCLVPAMGFPGRLRKVFVIPVYIMPVICILMTYNCIILALGSAIKGLAAVGIAKATYSIVVPLYLVVVFEVAYVMHKLRSVKFFGIVFDQGHRVNIDACSWLWRYLVRMVAFGLMAMGIITNYTIAHDDNKIGTGGYAALDKNSSILFILFLVPSTAVAVISLIIGIAIKRYGKNASIVVDSSCCNRWTSATVGAICVLLGNIPRATFFRVSSQAGLTAFLFTLVLLFNEIEREIEATQQFTIFLDVENQNVKSLNPHRASFDKRKTAATVTGAIAATSASNPNSGQREFVVGGGSSSYSTSVGGGGGGGGSGSDGNRPHGTVYLESASIYVSEVSEKPDSFYMSSNLVGSEGTEEGLGQHFSGAMGKEDHDESFIDGAADSDITEKAAAGGAGGGEGEGDVGDGTIRAIEIEAGQGKGDAEGKQTDGQSGEEKVAIQDAAERIETV